MRDPASIRSFLRLVVACAILVQGAALIVMQGGRDSDRFRGAIVLDRDRLGLTEEVESYGAAADGLRARLTEETRP